MNNTPIPPRVSHWFLGKTDDGWICGQTNTHPISAYLETPPPQTPLRRTQILHHNGQNYTSVKVLWNIAALPLDEQKHSNLCSSDDRLFVRFLASILPSLNTADLPHSQSDCKNVNSFKWHIRFTTPVWTLLLTQAMIVTHNFNWVVHIFLSLGWLYLSGYD